MDIWNRVKSFLKRLDYHIYRYTEWTKQERRVHDFILEKDILTNDTLKKIHHFFTDLEFEIVGPLSGGWSMKAGSNLRYHHPYKQEHLAIVYQTGHDKSINIQWIDLTTRENLNAFEVMEVFSSDKEKELAMFNLDILNKVNKENRIWII